jgi:hypothetical protein
MARAEITGCKPRVTQDRPQRRPGPPRAHPEAIEPTPRRELESIIRDERPPIRGPPLAFSIAEFCRAHGISESMYFKMRAQGLGPREMSVGTRKLISLEAAAAWRRARERKATTA